MNRRCVLVPLALIVMTAAACGSGSDSGTPNGADDADTSAVADSREAEVADVSEALAATDGLRLLVLEERPDVQCQVPNGETSAAHRLVVASPDGERVAVPNEGEPT